MMIAAGSRQKITFPPKTPSVRKTKNTTKKIKKRMRATRADAAEVRVKPKRPAKIETKEKNKRPSQHLRSPFNFAESIRVSIQAQILTALWRRKFVSTSNVPSGLSPVARQP